MKPDDVSAYMAGYEAGVAEMREEMAALEMRLGERLQSVMSLALRLEKMLKDAERSHP